MIHEWTSPLRRLSLKWMIIDSESWLQFAKQLNCSASEDLQSQFYSSRQKIVFRSFSLALFASKLFHELDDFKLLRYHQKLFPLENIGFAYIIY